MSKKSNVEQIIGFLGLKPHPEGGYFKETYRSAEMVNLVSGDARNAGTGIFFLLPAGVCSDWHRVRSDELWHFYDGDKLKLEIINADGNFRQLTLGDDLPNCSYQGLVPANCWQRAYSIGEYSLVGCTVSPGFEFDDFEMVDPKVLAGQYSDIASKIIADPFE